MKRFILAAFSCSIIHGLIAQLDETNSIHNFFLANYHQAAGELDKAQKGYQRIFLSPDTPVHVYKGYLPLLAATKNHQQIVALIPKLQEHFRNDPDIQLIFGQALEGTGKQKEADDLYIKLSREFKTHQEVIYQAVNSYRRNQERENAIKVIDDLLNHSPRKPNNFVFYFMKAQLYTELSDAPNARICVNKSLELYPSFDKGWLLFGMLEENAGKLDDAIKGYSNFLEYSGTSNQQLEKHLLELLIRRRMVDTKQKAMAVDNKCLLDGLSLFQKKQYKDGMHSINKCLEKEPTHQDATIIKINMLSQMRKHRQALKLLSSCLHENPHDEFWYTQLHVLCTNGLSERHAIKLLRDVIHTHPHAALAHIHKAELHARNYHHPHESIFHYQRALEYVHAPAVECRIMYTLACLYAQTGNYNRMKTILTTSIEKYPTYMPAHHLLAFHYLEYDAAIPQATDLLTQLIKQDPANSHYRITYARLMHASGQHEKALLILNETRICTSDTALIDEHRYAIAQDYMHSLNHNFNV